jgi:hypothetical protein
MYQLDRHDSLFYKTPNWRIKVLFCSKTRGTGPTPRNGGTFETNDVVREGHDSFVAGNTFVIGGIVERVGI